MDKQFQEKLELFVIEFLESLDGKDLEEYYNTDLGYGMHQFRKFYEYHNLEIPEIIKEYYK
ncbi:hypothetical protein KW795_03015 [Candidatus Microgenomates bacterium]|nr:hypothetical protein [Candidatus Microgenomates bacterium]